MSELYREQIIDRYRNPQSAGPLATYTHIACGENLSCGDEITWQVEMTPDSILDQLAHVCRACAICTASADLIAETLKGRPQAAITALTPAAIQELLGIQLSPVRLKCALLPLETLKNLKPGEPRTD